jgi:hypothetical protein
MRVLLNLEISVGAHRMTSVFERVRSFASNKNKRDDETRWAMLITALANSTSMPSLVVLTMRP